LPRKTPCHLHRTKRQSESGQLWTWPWEKNAISYSCAHGISLCMHNKHSICTHIYYNILYYICNYVLYYCILYFILNHLCIYIFIDMCKWLCVCILISAIEQWIHPVARFLSSLELGEFLKGDSLAQKEPKKTTYLATLAPSV
jgi:hypothetical protein